MTNNTKFKNSGFTIVELLIVIVVIAILAAISIVAYNGIQNRSKASAAQSAAQTAAKKAEVYAADGPTSAYPLLTADLTGAAATTTYQLTGVTFTGTAGDFTAGTPPATPSTLVFRKCGSGAPANQAAITGANITGNQFAYYDYANGGATVTVNVGSGTCPTS